MFVQKTILCVRPIVQIRINAETKGVYMRSICVMGTMTAATTVMKTPYVQVLSKINPTI
jgi:hypothetical protein